MQVLFKNVKLVYTNGMTQPGKFGYGYSFIVDKSIIAEKALGIAQNSKKVKFTEKELTPARMLNFMNAKTVATLREAVELKDDPASLNDILAHMGPDDVLIGVKAKDRVKATRSDVAIGWFSTADILIDLYATEYQGRKFISRFAASDKITVKVTEYAPMLADPNPGFESEDVVETSPATPEGIPF